MERSREEAETARVALSYTKAKVHRIASNIDGVRVYSKGAKINWREYANMVAREAR